MIPEIRKSLREIVRCLGFINYQQRYFGLSVSQVHTMIELDIRGTMTAQELAGFLFLDKSTVSRMLDGLHQLGTIIFKPNPQDARSKVIKLSAAGVKLVAKINANAAGQTKRALDLLTAEEKEVAKAGLALMAKALAREVADGSATITNFKE